MRAELLVLLMTLAAGCALGTTPITMETGTPVPGDRIEQRELTEPAPERTAKVSFLRDSGFAGGACTHFVGVDGKPAFGIRAGEYQTLYLAPGAHDLTVSTAQGVCSGVSLSGRVALHDKEEKIYRISTDLMNGRPVVAELSESTERAASPAPKFGPDSVSTPGFSLTMKEEGREATSRGTQVRYSLASTGFPASASLPFWYRVGHSSEEMWASVGADGAVKVVGADFFVIGDYVSGQPIELALVSGESRAFAKAVPFPIEASIGDYRLSVEVMSKTGLLFFVTGSGFQPGEDVEVVSEFDGERLAKRTTASSKGDVAFPVLFDKGDDGRAKLTMTGRSGSVWIEYGVGEDALVLR